jgi:hypothetical protein
MHSNLPIPHTRKIVKSFAKNHPGEKIIFRKKINQTYFSAVPQK